MDSGEMLVGFGQIVSSLVLGGIAIMYSHKVHKIEKERDRSKVKETKLKISKDGYKIANQYNHLPVSLIKMIPSINQSSMYDEYKEFLKESQKVIEEDDFSIKVEKIYFEIFKKEAQKVEEEYFNIVNDIGAKNIDITQQLTDFTFDIKNLDIQDENLDQLLNKLFKFLKMQPSLDWTAPVLIAHFNIVYSEIAESVFEISAYIMDLNKNS